MRASIFPKREKKGQVAIILILVAAAGLIFYAITLNLGRLSQVKVLVTVASNTTASQLASQMASYGQSVSEEQLGGRFRKCKWSGVLRSLIMGVVLGGLMVFVAFVVVQTTGINPWFMVLIGGPMAIPLTLQMTVIEPTLTHKWNKVMSGLPTVQDNFSEQGIMAGLQGSVTDSMLVPDLYDEDQDQLWGYDANGEPRDRISRFSIYYNERLKSIKPKNIVPIVDFTSALQEFLYDDPFNRRANSPPDNDDWGIIDPWPNCPSSECNPCCVPETDPADPSTLLRPEDCTPAMVDMCDDFSPYGTSYPWVYDRFYEQPANTFLSFREQLGRDDENQLFLKSPTNPNSIQTATGVPPPPLPPDNFLIQDTTGYYPADQRRGIFTYLYKLSDWGIDLDILDPTAYTQHCYWWGKDTLGNSYDSALCPTATVLPPELQAQSLILPNDPATLAINRFPYVDSIKDNPGSGNPPLAPDKIGYVAPSGSGPLYAIVNDPSAPPFCADRILTNAPEQGFWKKGADRFCASGPNAWPYYGACPKTGSCSDEQGCLCGESGTMPPENWPDDSLDDIVYELENFIQDAQEILAIGTVEQIADDFENWYPKIAAWIEPGTGPEPTGSGAAPGTNCFICNAQDGILVAMQKMIREMRERFENLRDTSYATDTPNVCDEVWCVPGDGCTGGRDSSALGGRGPESNTFNVNAGAPRGDMVDVITCLDWNVNDPMTTSDGQVTVTGNAQKFQGCYTACNNLATGVGDPAAETLHANDLCSKLPRSLVPAINVAATGYVDAATSCPVLLAAGLNQSFQEAQNQVEKFRQRLVFLQNRLTEINNTIAILANAETKFNEFLTCDDGDSDGEPDGAACKLIKARINYSYEASGLPYQAIYGWQDEPTPERPIGLWHIVKVDVRIPKKCDNACGIGSNETFGDIDPPSWPWVRTYQKKWGLKRCFEMADTDGMVKARITRFDENRGSSVLFPNGVPLWQFRYFHPERPAVDTLVGLGGTCANATVTELPDGTPTGIYNGAFILNELLGPGPPCSSCNLNDGYCLSTCEKPGNTSCWNRVQNILTQGVTTETCAKYYWHGGSRDGMGFKFVPCPNF